MEIEAKNIETKKTGKEKYQWKEEENIEEKKGFDPILGSETSPQDTIMSLDITDQEVAATLATLSTKRQTPMYFRTRKSQRVRKKKPQTPTNNHISIQESTYKDD